MKNIILIGFMCSGKTTVAPMLAKELSKESIEMDYLVRKLAGKTTEEIFAQDGEEKYRELETAVANLLENQSNAVISTGGGSIMKESTMNYLKKENNIIVYLEASFDELKKRLSPKIPRPLFKDIAAAKKLYDLRLPLYRAYADITIQTNDKNPKKIVEEIIEKIHL